MLHHYLLIGLGAGLGAVARVALGKALPAIVLGIPFHILFVNILGCFALGLLIEFMALSWSASENTRHFLISGFLGGFTTFSAFALEFGLLYTKGNYISTIIYAALSFALSITFFFVGIKIIRLLITA